MTSGGPIVEDLVLGQFQANCYIVGDRSSGRAVVIDPGQDGARPVQDRLEALGLVCEAILLTHGHIDHLWSAPELARSLDLPVLLHPDDRWLWDDPGGSLPPGFLEAQFGLRWQPATERLEDIRDGQRLPFAGLGLTVRHTPGHTPGSCVFLLQDASVLWSGDLVFAGSVGRTDFPRGSWEQQMDSISRVVLPLPDTTVIWSGHGPRTTVGAERRSNPFLRELA